MVESGRSEGRGGGGGCGSGVGWVAASATAASSASYASANLSPLPAAKIAASSYHQYPAPLAKYEDVVANPKLFMDTLEKLHGFMRTKFMIPIIGGKELDLHQLFVEVTSRGGIEKILREKKWKEVTAIFNFPSTATNASFVLRKYYYSLLQHYEQIYYFKAQGWTPLPAGSLQSPSVVPIAVHGLASMSTAPQCHQSAANSAAQQPSTMNPTEFAPPAANAAPSVGSPVVGVIDGKFESGYLVTVTIGTEKLKGVLYQAPSTPISVNPAAFPSSKNIDNNSNSNHMAPSVGTQRRRRRRKKSEIRKRDPAHPKPNRSGYNFFFAEQHARLKPLYPGKDREISRMIGELWTNLKDNDKLVYQEKALEDKERYRMEMERYRERLKAGQVISDAVPLRQRLPDLDANMVEVDVKEEDTAPRDSAETPEIDESASSMSEEEEEEEEEADIVGGSLATGASDSNAEVSSIIGPETRLDLGKTSQKPSVVDIEASHEGPGGDVLVPGEGKQNMVPDCEKPISPPAAATT